MKWPFLLKFLTKSLYSFLYPSTFATCPVPVILDLIFLTLLAEEQTYYECAHYMIFLKYLITFRI
jgi:hypothetical protein